MLSLAYLYPFWRRFVNPSFRVDPGPMGFGSCYNLYMVETLVALPMI
jgi:hypothetical protein